jgi:hypothetical protein
MKEHWLKVVTAKKRINSTHIQIGKPRIFCRFFLGGSGLGNSVWQRQQIVLSSGFHVPQLGQFGMFEVSWWIQRMRIVAQSRPASKIMPIHWNLPAFPLHSPLLGK